MPAVGPIHAFELPAHEDLGARCIRSGAVTGGAQLVRLALVLTGTIALARQLAPADFGLVAMASALLGLLAVARELGLSLATVQRDRIRAEQVSALFWVNLAFGLALAAVTAALAPLVAWFYGDARLNGVVFALAAAFAVGGAAVQHRALLQRGMRFGALAAVDLVALAVSTALAIAAASLGAGYWALVVLPVAQTTTASALLWRACPWRPGPPTRGADVRSLLTFGGHVTGTGLLHQLSRNLDTVLIGWFWGAAPLGLYTKAYQLALMPIRNIQAPLASVAIPVLSRLQRDPERFRHFYLKSLRLVAFAGLPGLAAVAVLSREIVALVLGERWLAASPLLAVLACAAAVQLIAGTLGWIFVALGHTRRMLRWSGLASGATILSFAIGLPWGPLGVAVAYTVCVYALRYPHLAAALRDSPVSIADVLRAIHRPVLLALTAALAMAPTRTALQTHAPTTILLCTLCAGAGAWLVSVLLLRRAREDFAEVRDVVWRLVAARSNAAARPPVPAS
ncbi:MAG: lipopolysaccharide biosynthesis protein [Deltaproteobacteria bacterium]|nr:MAG: lipopolysaccharide biosynthesis protein [Deltaproteobacteria bacterium]